VGTINTLWPSRFKFGLASLHRFADPALIVLGVPVRSAVGGQVVGFDVHDLVEKQVPAILAQLAVPAAVAGEEQDRGEARDPAGRRELEPGVGEVDALGDDVGVAVEERLAEDEFRQPGFAAGDGPWACQVLALEEEIHPVDSGEVVQAMERRRIEADRGTRQLGQPDIEVEQIHNP